MDDRHLKEFKRSYHRCGKYNLYVQIPHLVKLADRYREKYRETKHWTDCLKVRGFLHIQFAIDSNIHVIRNAL